jgi:hypothetical protein
MKSYEFESGAEFTGGSLLGRIEVQVETSTKGSGLNKGKWRNTIKPVEVILTNKKTGKKTASIREAFNSKTKLDAGTYTVGVYEADINNKLTAYLAL